MRLKTKYILWGTCFYVAILGSMFFLAKENMYVFFALEALLIASLIIYISLYRQFVQPIDMLNRASKLLQDKDFATRLSSVGQKEFDNLIDIYNKMIAQLQNERTKQEESYHLFQSLSQASPMGIVLLNYDEAIEQINPAAAKILGKEQNNTFLKKTLTEIDGALAAACSLLQVNASEIVAVSGTERFFIYKGTFLDRGFYRHYILLQEMSSELLRAEKEAYVRVIRTMSHEVNNTVGAINSILDSVSDELQPDSQEAVQVAIQRNNNMAFFMKKFADIVKLSPPAKQKIEMNGFVNQLVLLFQKSCQEQSIVLNFTKSEQEFFVHADRYQLEQVAINILKNAQEAITDGGEISIVINRQEKEMLFVNNGKPINEHDAKQLFTPFFTTRENGQGIGLTLVRDILTNHSFDFSLRTEKSGLTVFRIRFGAEK